MNTANLRLPIYSALLILPFVLPVAGKEKPDRIGLSAQRVELRTSLVAVLSAADKFVGKRIDTTGYLGLDLELIPNARLFNSSEDAKLGRNDSCLLFIADQIQLTQQFLDRAKGKLVWVEGTILPTETKGGPPDAAAQISVNYVEIIDPD